MPKFKCDICGRFISIEDLTSGNAIRQMVTPESDLSYETYETLCKEHAKFACAIHGIEFKLKDGCKLCIAEES